MNKSKTKEMKGNDTPIYANNTLKTLLRRYIYLEQRYSTRDKNQDKDIHRRIKAGWSAFAKHRHIHWNMFEETCLQPMRTSSNDLRRGNIMGTHDQSIEQATNRTNKNGNDSLTHCTRGDKITGLGKRMD